MIFSTLLSFILSAISFVSLATCSIFKKTADKHNLMNNKLTSIARRMTANERARNKTKQHEENVKLSRLTMQAYLKEAATITKRENLTQRQKGQIKENWKKRSTKTTKQQIDEQRQAEDERLNQHHDNVTVTS